MGTTCGFLLTVIIGSAFADEPTSSTPVPTETEGLDEELALAVVVAASADSIDLNAVARLSASDDYRVERGTVVQLSDGRVATVAHALVDANRLQIAQGQLLDLPNPNAHAAVATSRLHDLTAISAAPLPAALDIAESPALVGQTVAIAGIPEDERVAVVTGEIISRTAGTHYGIGRPDVYVISAAVAPGWSGGPVVNAQGEVVAIVVGSETRSGVTLAVPIEYLPQP